MLSGTTLVGIVQGIPDLKYDMNQKPFAQFAMDVETGYGEYKRTTQWWVTMYGKKAEIAHQKLVPGCTVLVEGELLLDETTMKPKIYQSEDGSPVAGLDITAQTVVFVNIPDILADKNEQEDYLKTRIIGRLGRNPELKYTDNAKPYCKFSLAVDVGFGADKKTAWYDITVWDKQAETANQYLSKGSIVYVEGVLEVDNTTCRPRIYTGQDGVPKSTLAVRALNVRFIQTDRNAQAGAGTVSAPSGQLPAYQYGAAPALPKPVGTQLQDENLDEWF